MYSVVLLAALAAAPATPDFNGLRVGLHGYRSGCYGIPHGGCQGYVSSGCVGGGCYGTGCYGGCGGCQGFSTSSWGCYGYGNGGFHGNYTWYGQGYGNQSFSCHGCYGCYGGYSCYGAFVPGMNVAPAAVPVAPLPPLNPSVVTPPRGGSPSEPPVANPAPPSEETPLPKKEGKVGEQTRARVLIIVPEGGKLFVDGQAMSGAAGVRTFQTPPLNVGQVYFYDVRIVVTRDGQERSEQQRIVLRPGQEVTASFPILSDNTARRE